jgi:5'-3' exonuclease
MLLYRAAYGNQTVVDFGDGLGAAPLVDERLAIQNAMRIVASWQKLAQCSSSILCLSSIKSDNFRHRLFAGYKANRKDNEKPEGYHAIREALEAEFETYAEPNLEADDLMGIASTTEKAQCVIVSGDKDMQTIPGLLLNPFKHAKPIRVRQAQADEAWLRQTIIGDAVDGYPGIKGAGPTAADAILTSPHRLRKVTEMVGKKAPKPKTKWVKGEPTTVWQSMLDYAAKAGMSTEELIVQAQLARILRAGDFNKETRTVRLWRPGGHQELRLDETA